MEYREFSGKTVDEALTEALVALGTTSDQVEYEVVDRGSSGFFGINSKPATIRVRKKEDSVDDEIRGFLGKVFQAMHMEVEIEITQNEEEGSVDVELKGNDMGVLIGKRGQTLDALQYLTNLVVNKHPKRYTKIKLDTEDYRRRRTETLENLAKNVAYRVKRTKKNVALEPMKPFERRIIHSALQGDKYVETYSEGEEPHRYVVVALKENRKS